MTNYNGTDFLISLGDGENPEVFTEIACMKSTSLAVNNEQIDVTSKCSTPWRKLLQGGVRSLSLSLSGVFNDTLIMRAMSANAFAGAISTYRISSGYGDSYTGSFQLVSMERSGEHADAETFDVSLESAGDISHSSSAIPIEPPITNSSRWVNASDDGADIEFWIQKEFTVLGNFITSFTTRKTTVDLNNFITSFITTSNATTLSGF